MRWYHWLWVPVIVFVAIAAFIFGRRENGSDLASSIGVELDALDARAVAKHYKAELGAEKAAHKIEERYQNELEKLNAEGKKKADELRSDPVALAEYLVRVGRR